MRPKHPPVAARPTRHRILGAHPSLQSIAIDGVTSLTDPVALFCIETAGRYAVDGRAMIPAETHAKGVRALSVHRTDGGAFDLEEGMLVESLDAGEPEPGEPFPPSVVCAPIFAAFSALALLAGAGRRQARGPRTDGLAERCKRHARRVLPELHEAVERMASDLGFEREIAEMLFEWLAPASWPTTWVEADLDAWVTVPAFGKRILCTSEAQRDDVYARAARRQLAMLLEAALIAGLEATRRGLRVPPTTAGRLLSLGARVGRVRSPVGDELVREAAREWLREPPWTSRDCYEDLRRWLSGEMKRLAEAT